MMGAASAWSQATFPIDALSARLEAVAERRADFDEIRYLHALTRPLRSHGSLLYRRPDYIEKDTVAPAAERMVVEGGRLTVTAGDDAPQVIALDSRPEVAALVETIRDALSGNIKDLQRYYSIAGEGSLAGWSLSLTPTDPVVGWLLKSVRIDGRGTDLTFIQIVQSNGDDDRLTITPKA